METNERCPKCGSEQRPDLDPHWWICGSCLQGNGELVQTKICEHSARLQSQLAAETKRADEAEAKREDLLAMIAVESGHIQSHWASPYEKVGMEGMIEKLRSEKAAAESARDDAVRERDRLRETLAAFIREVGELQVYYAALLQPQEVGDGE